MTTSRNFSVGSEWLEVIIREYVQEVREETQWTTFLLTSVTGRRLPWCISSILGVNSKGVPGTACMLLERYIARSVHMFVETTCTIEQYNRFIKSISNEFYLLTVACVLLAGKMSGFQALLNADRVRSCLLNSGANYSTAQIRDVEFYVFNFLDYHLPIWNTLEIIEYLAFQVGLRQPRILEALGATIDLTECYRDIVELHMFSWVRENRNNRGRMPHVHNLFLCAATVSATALFLHLPGAGLLASKLAEMLGCDRPYLSAMSDFILHQIILEAAYVPIINRVSQGWRFEYAARIGA